MFPFFFSASGGGGSLGESDHCKDGGRGGKLVVFSSLFLSLSRLRESWCFSILRGRIRRLRSDPRELAVSLDAQSNVWYSFSSKEGTSFFLFFLFCVIASRDCLSSRLVLHGCHGRCRTGEGSRGVDDAIRDSGTLKEPPLVPSSSVPLVPGCLATRFLF